MSELTTNRENQSPAACCAPEYYKPDVDVSENEREFIFTADIPGSTADSIDVKYENGKLEIRASVEKRAVTEGRQLTREYSVADFYRSFEVGEALDADQAQAEYKDGVLTLRMPKLKSAQAKKIAVQRS